MGSFKRREEISQIKIFTCKKLQKKPFFMNFKLIT